MEQEKKKVALLSVFAAIFLTGFKFVIGILSGSLGILSEALHSALDLVAAVITYFSVNISDKPSDKNHHFGHGKVENLSALIETILLLVTCVWVIYEAIHRLITGATEIEVSVWAYVVVITSIVIDFTRSRALKKVAEKHNSQALEADALHFSTDIWSSAVVLVGLVCAQFGFFIADAIAALMVAGIIIYVSFQLGRKAIDVLLDKAPNESITKVEDILKNNPEVRCFHNLKMRTAGADTFIKFNIHLDPLLNFQRVHEICDALEMEIGDKIERSEIFIHAEPHKEKTASVAENEEYVKCK